MPDMNFSLINTKLDQLRSMLPMKAEYRQKLDNKFRMEFNYNSNHIEGNTLTYGETVLLLIHGQTKGNHEVREYEEMQAHDVALELIKKWAKNEESPLTEADIKELNRILLVKPFWKEALTADGQPTRRLINIGNYKEYPNSVRLQNGEMFEYASPMDTPIQMGELIQWFREEEGKKELHPVQLAALLHYNFVRIHPFDDGNGRISRLLMNYVLLKNDYPPIIIKSEDKKNYLRSLNLADSGDLDAFVEYIAEQALWSIDISIKAAKGESIDEPGDLDKKIDALKKKLNYKEEVKFEKSNEIVKMSYQQSIKPLIISLRMRLKKFDSLFKSQTENLLFFDAFNEQITSTKNISAVAENILADRSNVIRISYKYILMNLRAKQKAVSFSASLDVYFHKIVYEVKSEDEDFSITKLYHESFNEFEQNEIAEKIGNKLFEEIETELANSND